MADAVGTRIKEAELIRTHEGVQIVLRRDHPASELAHTIERTLTVEKLFQLIADSFQFHPDNIPHCGISAAAFASDAVDLQALQDKQKRVCDLFRGSFVVYVTAPIGAKPMKKFKKKNKEEEEKKAKAAEKKQTNAGKAAAAGQLKKFSDLSLDNCLDRLKKYEGRDPRRFDVVLEYVDTVAESLCTNKSFRGLPERLLTQIISRDTLKVSTENAVFDGVMDWAVERIKTAIGAQRQNDPTRPGLPAGAKDHRIPPAVLRRALQGVLGLIRLPLMTAQHLVERVRPLNLDSTALLDLVTYSVLALEEKASKQASPAKEEQMKKLRDKLKPYNFNFTPRTGPSEVVHVYTIIWETSAGDAENQRVEDFEDAERVFKSLNPQWPKIIIYKHKIQDAQIPLPTTADPAWKPELIRKRLFQYYQDHVHDFVVGKKVKYDMTRTPAGGTAVEMTCVLSFLSDKSTLRGEMWIKATPDIKVAVTAVIEGEDLALVKVREEERAEKEKLEKEKKALEEEEGGGEEAGEEAGEEEPSWRKKKRRGRRQRKQIREEEEEEEEEAQDWGGGEEGGEGEDEVGEGGAGGEGEGEGEGGEEAPEKEEDKKDEEKKEEKKEGEEKKQEEVKLILTEDTTTSTKKWPFKRGKRIYTVPIKDREDLFKDSFIPITVGMRVGATWKQLVGSIFDGVIAKVNDDGTFRIEFDDGDIEEFSPRNYIKRPDASQQVGIPGTYTGGDQNEAGTLIIYKI